ncbi:MAG: hypothetical protein WCI36_04395 [bacterium]
MNDNYSDNILNEFVIPHIAFPQDTIQQKKILAWHIVSLKKEDLLFSSAFAFSYQGLIAGINTVQIEYFAKNATISQKKELLISMLADYRMKEVFEIAKLMDDDMGENISQNQQRVKNVQRYVFDNLPVFQF